jgi:cell fate regulator YaaT (PSP1 superfamily)
VELDYGLDYGEVLELFGLNEDGKEGERMPSFRVVRRLDSEESARLNENREIAEKARNDFGRSVSREKGGVRVLHVRLSYGRERLFIRYAAQVPVDLRRFLGQIQRDYKTHVDLWQVGVRDEAALVGCLGQCGRAACCCSWQRQFETVNVRMAKTQEMSLNPIAINGSCGRLKCCLRFEYEQYRQASEGLPAHGSIVRGETGDEGMVVSRDVMSGLLTVRTRDGRFLSVPVASTTVLQAAQSDGETREDNHESAGPEWSEP